LKKYGSVNERRDSAAEYAFYKSKHVWIAATLFQRLQSARALYRFPKAIIFRDITAEKRTDSEMLLL